MKLRDQVAIVTGGGRGIGKATALRLSREGCSVVLAARTQREIEATAEGITKARREALAVTADVRSREQMERLVEECVTRFGRIDILVNNAGVGFRKPLVETSEAEWRETIDTNLTGKFLCTRAVL
ncbi:MAG: SDR family NAD(P)-dependent oxidoreductase, partial [Candidatus Geothermarchaeales archaeon]